MDDGKDMMPGSDDQDMAETDGGEMADDKDDEETDEEGNDEDEEDDE